MVGISFGATIFLLIEGSFFVFLIYSLIIINKNTKPILSILVRSLRVSEDLFGDERNFVTSARTRYRRAAERIEDVDAYAIASGELGGYEVLRIWKWKINMGALSEIMASAPGVFITIGLLGTFFGLVLNLNELSNILSVGSGSSSSSPGDLVDRLGGILGPMSTAFVSSLGGVFFSLLFWLIAQVMGANRVANESEALLVAYLEQIVQADCNRYSLMRASVERMELCLAEFMSKFGERVGSAIDNAISKKIDDVFEAIKVGSDALAVYSCTMHQGVDSLSESSKLFFEASTYFSNSTFPLEFGNSVNALVNSSTALSTSAQLVSSDLKEIAASKDNLKDDWDQAQSFMASSTQAATRVLEGTNEHTKLMNSALEELAESTKQLRSARLSIGKENKTSDDLSRALIRELENGQPQRVQLTSAIQNLSTLLQQRQSIDEKLFQLLEIKLAENTSPLEQNISPITSRADGFRNIFTRNQP
ncbi:MotA/TolQ/ExbB proton channel family protein [Synechococcus sp. UW140]|uniref:MotA/TolQ/ExbB proton channel family protein n=1 Tax=Synechococcus sp. UW140 TaxID=368503 RepID=UPI0025CD7E10|nr:MotA/TolQ/ExbB proton channel family protein [Synechococcus sp. UW140]